QGGGVDAPCGQAQHETSRAPVREVEVRVEVSRQERRRIRLEITEVVLVPEPGRRDLRARGDRAQLRHLLGGEPAIQGDELVALVLAHDSSLLPESRSTRSASSRSRVSSALSSSSVGRYIW